MRPPRRGGLIHGDVKPENILFDDKKTAKIVDFGLASPVGGSNELSGVWGTPHYIAPERCRKEKIDCTADIYSLGATLYYAIANRQPFPGSTMKEVLNARLNRPPKRLRSFNNNVAPEVDALLQRMMQPDRAKRHPNFKALLGSMSRTYQVVPKTRKLRTKQKPTGQSAAIHAPSSRDRHPGRQARRRRPNTASSSEVIRRRVVIGIIVTALLLLVGLLVSDPPRRHTMPRPKSIVPTSVSVLIDPPSPKRTTVLSRPEYFSIQNGFFVIEAEMFHASHKTGDGSAQSWQEIKDPQASGGRAMQAPKTGSFEADAIEKAPRLDYNIEVRTKSPGKFRIWVRARAEAKAGTMMRDVFHVMIDGKPGAYFHNIGYFKLDYKLGQRKTEKGNPPFVLENGKHRVSVVAKQPGVIVDSIILAPHNLHRQGNILQKFEALKK